MNSALNLVPRFRQRNQPVILTREELAVIQALEAMAPLMVGASTPVRAVPRASPLILPLSIGAVAITAISHFGFGAAWPTAIGFGLGIPVAAMLGVVLLASMAPSAGGGSGVA